MLLSTISLRLRNDQALRSFEFAELPCVLGWDQVDRETSSEELSKQNDTRGLGLRGELGYGGREADTDSMNPSYLIRV